MGKNTTHLKQRHPMFLVSNSRKPQDIQSAPSFLRGSKTVKAIRPDNYSYKYRILFSANKKIKQIKCARCMNPTLNPFLVCICNNIEKKPLKNISFSTVTNNSAFSNHKSSSRSRATQSKMSFNYSTISLNAGLTPISNMNNNFDKSLLNIIVKNRLPNLNGEEIDELIRSQKIVTENWSSPFKNDSDDDDRSESLKSPIADNKYNFLQKRRVKNLTPTTTNLNESLTWQNDHYSFKDLNDLQLKYFFRNEPPVKLVDTGIPYTSNKYYDRINRFDVANSYKMAYHQVSPDIRALVIRNQVIVDRINRERVKSVIPQRFGNKSHSNKELHIRNFQNLTIE